MDRRAEFAAFWVLLIHIVSVSVYVCRTKVRCGHTAHQWLEFLHSGWPWSPMCCQFWIIQHPQPLYFFSTLFFCSSFLLTVSVSLHSKRRTHIIKGISVQSHLLLSWCTALGHGTALFVSKSLHESVFWLEYNDWFCKGSNQMVKSGANNTLETLWLH